MAKEPTATPKDDQTKATAPTVQMRPAPNRPGDPVTNATEEQMLKEQQQRDEEAERKAIEEQEERARVEQENFEKRQNLMMEIIKSPEGFVVQEEGNSEAVSLAYQEGLVYYSNVQSGPGGIEVQERVFLSQKGYDALRTTLGPNMGK
jgi:hypothetical protein